MRRIGIFGGSFNPIHLGHIAVAQQVLKEGWVDEVWLMVSPQNPLKQAATDLAPETVRLAMAQTAVRDFEGIRVSDFEMSLPRPSYTWRTLEALCEAHPDCTFSLIIGADNWVNFSKWAHHEELLARYPLLVYPREGYPIDEKVLPASVHVVHAPLFPQSSTSIRERIQRGDSVDQLIPSCIVERAVQVYAP